MMKGLIYQRLHNNTQGYLEGIRELARDRGNHPDIYKTLQYVGGLKLVGENPWNDLVTLVSLEQKETEATKQNKDLVNLICVLFIERLYWDYLILQPKSLQLRLADLERTRRKKAVASSASSAILSAFNNPHENKMFIETLAGAIAKGELGSSVEKMIGRLKDFLLYLQENSRAIPESRKQRDFGEFRIDFCRQFPASLPVVFNPKVLTKMSASTPMDTLVGTVNRLRNYYNNPAEKLRLNNLWLNLSVSGEMKENRGTLVPFMVDTSNETLASSLLLSQTNCGSMKGVCMYNTARQVDIANLDVMKMLDIQLRELSGTKAKSSSLQIQRMMTKYLRLIYLQEISPIVSQNTSIVVMLDGKTAGENQETFESIYEDKLLDFKRVQLSSFRGEYVVPHMVFWEVDRTAPGGFPEIDSSREHSTVIRGYSDELLKYLNENGVDAVRSLSVDSIKEIELNPLDGYDMEVDQPHMRQVMPVEGMTVGSY